MRIEATRLQITLKIDGLILNLEPERSEGLICMSCLTIILL